MGWTRAKLAVYALMVLGWALAVVLLPGETDPMERLRSEWAVFGGDRDAWVWVDDAITAHTIEDEAIFASGKRYRDVTLSAIASSENREASFAVRMQDPDNGYIVIFAPARTPCPWNPLGKVELLKRIDGKDEVLAAYQGGMLSGMGSSAELAVSASGAQLQVFLDGVLVVEAEDATFPEGHIGLRVFGDPRHPCDATFSAVRVR